MPFASVLITDRLPRRQAIRRHRPLRGDHYHGWSMGEPRDSLSEPRRERILRSKRKDAKCVKVWEPAPTPHSRFDSESSSPLLAN